MNGKMNVMSKKSSKLTEAEAAAARERGSQYEASMAIEGIFLTKEEKAFIDKLDDDRVGYDEGIELTIKWLEKTYGSRLKGS
ncbi:MAG: hypothetical protein RLW87_08615 [Alphaproteobacteria bacterium]